MINKKGYNPYLILGYKTTKGGIPNEQIEEVTDEAIKLRYEKVKQDINKMIESKKNSSNKIIEQLNEWLNTLEMAYNDLCTEEKREKFNEPIIRRKQLKTMIGKLINKENGDLLHTPTRTEINKENRAVDVRKNPNYLEYTPEYEDENVKLIGIEEILFNNGNMYRDSIKKYMLISKLEEEGLMQGFVSFYSGNINNLQDKEYRIALFQAINRAGEGYGQVKKYIGMILKKENGEFEERRDGGQIDAMIIREKQAEIERKRENFEEDQGEGR